ncbi:MAG: DUF2624 family protein [Bacilli bacterium]|jgi:hypothetical protein|nr:DUF2624 family protein [Bacilli bacterium]
MQEFIIREYINQLTKEDIICLAKNNQISLDNKEVDIIYLYIKKHWQTFYNGNPQNHLKELKSKLRPTTYQKLEHLYCQLKNKIS